MAVPIAEDVVNNGAQVELGAESVEHHSTIDARDGEGSLIVNLEGMGVLRRLHHGVDNGIELEGHLVDLNGLERPGDKHIVCLRAAEPDMAMTGGSGPSVQKGNGGRPSMVQWQSYDRERDDDDSPMTTTNEEFRCSPIYILFYGHR